MIIVITTENATITMVNRMYLPSNGSASDVDGIISEISKKNMVCDRRMLIHNAIFSPESAGK